MTVLTYLPLKRRAAVLLAGASAFLAVAASACGAAQATPANVGGAQAVAAQAPAAAQAVAQAVTQRVTLHAKEFAYVPDTVQLKVGQPVDLTIINDGQVDHDIKSDLPISDLKYQKADNDAAEQKDNAAKGILDVDFNKGDTSEVSFVPTKAGTYPFACDEPGHKEAGMTGTFVVQP